LCAWLRDRGQEAAAACLERHWADFVSFYDFPEEQRIATVYRGFNLAAANGFVGRPIAADRLQLLHLPTVLQTRRPLAVLTARELAGVWHLPHATADVVLLERTTARRWLPLPTWSVRDVELELPAIRVARYP
jgi:hypothetical protein